MNKKKWIITIAVIVVLAIMTPLIVFMIMSTFVKSETITIELPPEPTKVEVSRCDIEVVINKDHMTFYLGEDPLNYNDRDIDDVYLIDAFDNWLSELGVDRLEQIRHNDSTGVLIACDPNMRYTFVDSVLQVLRVHGLDRFCLRTINDGTTSE